MAKAKVECTCKKCGAKFTLTKFCANRTDANNFESWAKESADTCADCRKKEESEERNKAVSDCGFELVQLSGTEKQVAWANDIRNKIVLMGIKKGGKDVFFKTVNKITNAKTWIEEIKDTVFNAYDFAEYAEKHGYMKIFTIETNKRTFNVSEDTNVEAFKTASKKLKNDEHIVEVRRA